MLAIQFSRVETRRQTEPLRSQTSKDCLGLRAARPGTGQTDHTISVTAVELMLRRTRPHGSAPVRRMQFRYSIHRINWFSDQRPRGPVRCDPLVSAPPLCERAVKASSLLLIFSAGYCIQQLLNRVELNRLGWCRQVARQRPQQVVLTHGRSQESPTVDPD